VIRRLDFILRYLRRPAWDSGIAAPEVIDFIAAHPPGSALDLGCGTGTSSLALARAGWRVTGVDFVPRAIRLARRKARAARLQVDFRLGDVTRLPQSLFTRPYSLVLDIGCFHGLPAPGKLAYLRQLPRLLAPGGTWLVYGFFKPAGTPGPGFTPDDIALAQETLTLVKRQDGTDKKGRPSTWLWFRK
jgi:SAM-dependent methyltransferase